ncbi:hypothetical protein CVT24_008058 [Panaeolus cyanescens]|uniref:lytic cellulose monooxygenase (C4-dehydrogenating) n=1 Tax=Panaeolus cyanescens TaxID=181874 RepID=A0A409W076_9AGAR|nr:hypothetical protein CVT24_008058 [Panaeolus cyanescens]
MKPTLVALVVAAAGVESVLAHGYLASVINAGVTYPGWAPFSDPYLNPVPIRGTHAHIASFTRDESLNDLPPPIVERRITDNGPVTDVSSKDITCNKGGNVPTTAFANIVAGSQVKFQWDQWGSSHSGPVMTYMAKCPNGCANFKGDSGSPWFKIDHWGWDKTASPPWGSDRLAAQGASWTVTIPKSISNGEYLLITGTVGGAQFYPHCVQVKITGGGSANPSGVALPGAYSPTEPGILTQLWWYSASNSSASYTIPGGPVWLMKPTLIALVITAAAIDSVAGHGYVASITTGGVTYPGWAPFTDPCVLQLPVLNLELTIERAERKITDNGPVTDVTSKDLTCNKGGNVPTTLFANVVAGSQVKFQWDQWAANIHSGPVLTYMAKCTNGCANFKGDSGSPWFKIDHFGYDRNLSPSWGSDRLSSQGASWTVTIPKSISNGEYLLISTLMLLSAIEASNMLSSLYRHEILALHAAGTVGGAQFYPHCFQIQVTGGGSANPSGVAIPGIYKATEPGVLTQLWWYTPSNTSATYTIPGGPVWSG